MGEIFMQRILVSDIYNVTQISKNNNDAWIEIQKALENIDDDILLDFEDIILIDPYNNDQFMKVMADSRIHVRVYDEELAKTLIIALKLGEVYRDNKVELVQCDEVYDPKEEARKKSIEILAKRLLDVVKHIDSSNIKINLGDTIQQLSDRKTLDALEKLIKDIEEQSSGLRKVVINLTDVVVQKNILEELGNFQSRLDSLGIFIDFESDDKETIEKINISSLNRNVSADDRINIIKNNISINEVVVAHKFKVGKKSDDVYTIYNNEEPGSKTVRVAIYRGIEGGEIILDTFDGKYFLTKIDYLLDKDGEEHPGLKMETWRIPVEKTGFYHHFLGYNYHINKPVQNFEEEFLTVNRVVGDSITSARVLFPEHIKMVLDDFGIDYNQVVLQGDINESRKRFRIS